MRKHLRRCLDSVLWQLHPEDECLVVCDGFVEPESSASYSLLSFPEPEGVAAARNHGLQAAKGDWVKFMDVDDVLSPFALNAFRADLNSIPADVAVVSGQQIKVHNGLVVGTFDPPVVDQSIERENPLLVGMVLVRRSHALAVGGFDPRIEFEEDWDFWLRLYRANYRFRSLPTPFCYYWIDDAERREKRRTHRVEGMHVREYLRKKYNLLR
jgi:glycosyltransferase involved in cell wall biosynthesis